MSGVNFEDFLAAAQIKTGGRLWSDKAGGPVDAFYLSCGSERIWLHIKYHFEGPGTFQTEVIEFGLEGKLILSRMSFDLAEIDLIKTFLQNYFSSAMEKKFAPFNAGKCTKVIFAKDWIERDKTKPK